MTIIARHLTISGRVQGVWYRDWTVQTAQGLGIRGWVRNRQDSSVEAVAIGEEEAVEAFIARCRLGSPASRVDGVGVTPIDAEPLDGFEKRPTA